MSGVSELSESDKVFLKAFLPPKSGTRSDGRDPGLPFVTLTYASSLDGMISLSPGVRTTLSGPETKSMTHYLRMHHDAILVGAGTAIADDPGLNSRYPGATLDTQPQPVIVDLRARWDVSGKNVLRLTSGRQGKAPWIISNLDVLPNQALSDAGGSLVHVEFDSTSEAGGGLGVPHTQGQQCSWSSILRSLRKRGIGSIMIEGGARVINSLLAEPMLVDSVIVTIAPTWLGVGGVAVAPSPKFDDAGQRVNSARLEHTVWRQFGADAVLCGRPMR
ncbi:bacterial bifunctional deaminase-reductase [Polychaeton citri CBS 116435]|uniref:2,5-diamino-6-ribosylamino-4(3H)-pyrimidinone 5'-phosphate reductase n=1 Tax=Polychaeton citri CBS 116435 TaxID=1314669 RepID=A0A9P4PZQ7_9PEZI|nr:bacterial bifunctional deaminase-reductase [Polychaeton citri CBS 116435]